MGNGDGDGAIEIDLVNGVKGIKVPKYLEWVCECSKKHSEKKTLNKLNPLF